MSQNLHTDDAAHREAQQLLPLLAGGTLTPEQQARVDEHLRHCAHCREDAALERRMRAAPPEAPAGLDPERALARLMPRLDPPRARPASPTLVARVRDWFGGGWMPWALAGQGALIAALVLPSMMGSDTDAYRGLSGGPTAAPGNVIVVFRADAQLGQVQRALHAHGARMVDGPTATGAYVLAVPPARQAQLIAQLKADGGVELAEALDAKGAR